MAKAIAIYTGGITELRQAAIRTDGAIFERLQTRNRYGYTWTPWKPVGRLDPDTVQTVSVHTMGFATLYRARPNDCNLNAAALFDTKGHIRVRLPD